MSNIIFNINGSIPFFSEPLSLDKKLIIITSLAVNILTICYFTVRLLTTWMLKLKKTPVMQTNGNQPLSTNLTAAPTQVITTPSVKSVQKQLMQSKGNQPLSANLTATSTQVITNPSVKSVQKQPATTKKIVFLLKGESRSKMFDALKNQKAMPPFKMMESSSAMRNPSLIKSHHIACGVFTISARINDSFLGEVKLLENTFGKQRTIILVNGLESDLNSNSEANVKNLLQSNGIINQLVWKYKSDIKAGFNILLEPQDYAKEAEKLVKHM